MKYYHYSTGRYALVDVFYRNIWLNISDESIAHEIRTTFLSKVGMIVYDLHFFKNWTEQTIDSECCLDWKLSVTTDESVTALSLSNLNLYRTQTCYETDLIINEPAKSLLTRDRQLDLQSQMMLFKKILEVIKIHKISVSKKEWWTPVVDINFEMHREEIYNEIKNIFSTEIDTDVIEERLFQLASNIFDKNFRVANTLLLLLNRLYA
jgi:hypothetical protein